MFTVMLIFKSSFFSSFWHDHVSRADDNKFIKIVRYSRPLGRTNLTWGTKQDWNAENVSFGIRHGIWHTPTGKNPRRITIESSRSYELFTNGATRWASMHLCRILPRLPNCCSHKADTVQLLWQICRICGCSHQFNTFTTNHVYRTWCGLGL